MNRRGGIMLKFLKLPTLKEVKTNSIIEGIKEKGGIIYGTGVVDELIEILGKEVYYITPVNGQEGKLFEDILEPEKEELLQVVNKSDFIYQRNILKTNNSAALYIFLRKYAHKKIILANSYFYKAINDEDFSHPPVDQYLVIPVIETPNTLISGWFNSNLYKVIGPDSQLKGKEPKSIDQDKAYKIEKESGIIWREQVLPKLKKFAIAEFSNQTIPELGIRFFFSNLARYLPQKNTGGAPWRYSIQETGKKEIQILRDIEWDIDILLFFEGFLLPFFSMSSLGPNISIGLPHPAFAYWLAKSLKCEETDSFFKFINHYRVLNEIE